MEFPLLNFFNSGDWAWTGRKKPPKNKHFDLASYSQERAEKQQKPNQTRLQSLKVVSWELTARLKNLLVGKKSSSSKPQTSFSESPGGNRRKLQKFRSKPVDGWSKRWCEDTSREYCVDIDAVNEIAKVDQNKEVDSSSFRREPVQENSLVASTEWGQNFTDAIRGKLQVLPSKPVDRSSSSKELQEDTSHLCGVDLHTVDEVARVDLNKGGNYSTLGLEPVEESTLVGSAEWGQKVKFVASRFAGDTTAHGYKNVISKYRGQFRKIAWILAIICVSFILMHCICQSIRQQQSHTFTSSVRSQPSRSLAFPTVTVCNPMPWNCTGPKGYVHIYHEDRDLSSSFNLTECCRNGSKRVDHLQRPFAEVMEKIFVNCSWETQDVPCANIFVRTESDVDGCYSFNGNISSQRNISSVGSVQGFSFKLNLTGMNNPEGIKVVVHDPEEVPNVLEKSILVGTGNMAHIGLQRHEYKFLPRPFRAYGSEYCEDMVETNASTHKQERYHYSRCLSRCRMDYIVKRCHCRGANLPEFGGIPYCRVDQFECFLEARKIAYTTSLEKLGCTCPLPCNKREYSWRMSASHYEKDIVIAKIFYEDLFTRIEEHIPMSTWLTLLGNIGGNMGLLTGASVLTMIEFLELVALVVYYSWKSVCRTARQKMGKLRLVRSRS